MKLELWLTGETSFDFVQTGIKVYQKRLQHLLSGFDIVEMPDIKNTKKLSENLVKDKEGEQWLKRLDSNDYLILFDERGKQYSSLDFASYLDTLLMNDSRKLVFMVGGAYGFSSEIYQRANAKVSLSNMTFSHQLIRLLITEQLYRAMAILRNLPYHHE